MALPIWQDYALNLGTGDSATFTLKTGGQTIYTGKAYKKPGAASIQLVVNDICADYLRQNLPTLTNGTTTAHPDLVKTFTLTSGSLSFTFSFLLDWSYDTDAPTTNLSAPIRHKAAPSQPVFDTVAGTGTTVHIGQTTVTLANGEKVTLTDSCDRYALLYVNAFGGWDSLLCSWNATETDNYIRHTSQHAYQNTSLSERGEDNYANEIRKTWLLNSGWLTDAEAERMHHLLGSTLVFLYDMAEGIVHPVVITNADCPYKTYRNQGRRMVSYEIQVQLARQEVRR